LDAQLLRKEGNMARPRKLVHEKRDRRFNLRLTPAELAHLHLQAQRAGLNPHEYARRRALGHALVVNGGAQKADPALVSELNRVGVNVNQLARATNMGRRFAGDWEDIAFELRQVLSSVLGGHGS